MDEQSSTVTIHPRKQDAASTTPNGLPTLLHTPAGLALLELQGTINLPDLPRGGEDEEDEDMDEQDKVPQATVPIGRLDFPDYNPATNADSTSWMRRVHLYVGPHQRLTGEVKKLPRPLAVIRKRKAKDAKGESDLEVVEVIHYKLLFSQRPEPMTESSF